MKRRACLIFNPVSGQGDWESELSIINRSLTPHFDLQIRYTAQDQDMRDLLPDPCIDDVDLVIAAGGDGTVSAVSSTLIRRSVPLGIIPRGTANAFAKALDIPIELEAACQAIAYGKKRAVDIIQYGTNSMILLAGIGLEAETVSNTDRVSKERLGILAYVMSGFEQLQDLKFFDVELILDGDRHVNLEASAVTIANAAPATSILAHGTAGVIPDDGLLDITVFAPHGSLEAIAASIELFRSAIKEEAAEQQSIQNFRAKRVRVLASPAQRVTVDGELAGYTPIEFKCVPQALIVCVPGRQP